MSQAFKILEFPIMLLLYPTMLLRFSFSEKAKKNVLTRPYGFQINLVSKRQNHKDDCAPFCGLLRKAEH